MSKKKISFQITNVLITFNNLLLKPREWGILPYSIICLEQSSFLSLLLILSWVLPLTCLKFYRTSYNSESEETNRYLLYALYKAKQKIQRFCNTLQSNFRNRQNIYIYNNRSIKLLKSHKFFFVLASLKYNSCPSNSCLPLAFHVCSFSLLCLSASHFYSYYNFINR